MQKNVIILTHGWTGSSVLAALLGRAGYGLGEETVRKNDYDTFENAELVTLNRELLERLAPGLDHEHSFSAEDVARIEAAADGLDLTRYREFVARCNRSGPWVWKDPRLTWTIRVWARVLDLSRTSFIVLTREDLQAWISANTRWHVQSWRFTLDYNHGITASNLRFLQQRGQPSLQMSFEDLLMRPEPTLARLSRILDLQLTLADLQAVCREPLYRKSRGVRDLARAVLIFAKNYRERDGRGRRNQTSSATSSL